MITSMKYITNQNGFGYRRSSQHSQYRRPPRNFDRHGETIAEIP
jgi:hypothetical protein